MSDIDPTPNQLSADEILQAVVTRLLGTPTLSADEVRELGIDLDATHPIVRNLIHITDPEGTQQYPAFQFLDGQIREEVGLVNTILGAGRDPIGVWDWWASAHSYLMDTKTPTPEHLLADSTQCSLLFRLARSVGEDI